MAKFSNKSLKKLDTVHPSLRLICMEAIKQYDFTVLEGIRSQEVQQDYFRRGKSKLDGVTKKSKHQAQEDGYSWAVDIAPYPIDWNNRERFYYLAGIMQAITKDLKNDGMIDESLRWGGDWDSDTDFSDQSFDDLPHFELKG